MSAAAKSQQKPIVFVVDDDISVRESTELLIKFAGWQPATVASAEEFLSRDVDAEKAAFMADSQVPWGVQALGGEISEPAWKSKPSWYLLTTEDRMIPPPAQRLMSQRAGSTVVEVVGSHAIYVSQPNAVAALIKQAAQGAAAATAAS